ncbi:MULTISPECIES: hypothetical protein [unclassified Micromonospora]|uniref:hypothetical protein n=1 Tax=unclassified Micromonospora TaxID=2617518 RepID=UPI002FF41FF9
MSKKRKLTRAILDVRLAKVVSEVLIAAAVSAAVNVATGRPELATIVLLVCAILLHLIVSLAATVFSQAPKQQSEPSNSEPASDRTREEVLAAMAHESAIRMRERWESLQLPSEVVDGLEFKIEELLPSMEQLQSGIALFTGDLGSGKSTLAEIVHRRAISAALRDPAERWPILVDTRSAARDGLTAIVERSLPEGYAAFSLVVDGLDEVGLDAAEEILKNARSLALGSPRSRIVIFARPGFVRWRDSAPIPPLSETQIGQILEIVAGRRLHPSTLPRSLRPELRKPLFAILAGRYFSLDRPRSVTPAGLLAILVEDVLAREKRPGVDVYEALRNLACRTTEYGGRVPESEIGPLEVRDTLIATRLVVRRNRLLGFPSPVIEQYFAAQALLAGEVPIERQLSSLGIWERWRLAWMLAVAIGSWEQSRSLISPLLSVSPGIASWLIGETVPKWQSRGESMEEDDPLALPPADVLKERIRTSLDVWQKAMPVPFELLAARYGLSWGSVQVELAVSANMADFQIWQAHSSAGDDTSGQSKRLLWHQAIGCASHPAWPWRFVQSVVSRVLEGFIKNFSRNPDVPSLEPEWYREVACSLLPGGFIEASLIGAAASVEKARSKAGELLGILLECNADVVQIGRNKKYSRHLLQVICDLSDAQLTRVMEGPYPGADRAPLDLEGWNGYSPDRLALRFTAIYQAALAGYGELVSEFFADMTSMLNRQSLRPIEMSGDVRVLDLGAHVRYKILPLVEGSEEKVEILPFAGDEEFPGHSDEFLDEFRKRRARRAGLPSWTINTLAGGDRFSALHQLPATKLVVEWIWGDLKQIHLVEGMAPR